MKNNPELNEVKSELLINRTAAIAKSIWEEHYTPIIGEDQVKYMLNKFQSTEAIRGQIKDGYQYFLLSINGNDYGYLSVKKETCDTLFLSKIYVTKKQRGNGYGKLLINKVIEVGKALSISNIRLTVNKNNSSSIKAYEKMGFVRSRDLIQDIGNSYIMDDYEYLLSI